MSEQEIKNQESPEVDIGEDINVTTILTVGIVTGLVIIVIVIVLTGLFHQASSDYETAVNADLTDVKLTDLRNEQLGSLAGYGWVDPANDVVSIPVDAAISLTVAELNAARDSALAEPAAPDEPVGDEVAGRIDEEVEVEDHAE